MWSTEVHPHHILPQSQSFECVSTRFAHRELLSILCKTAPDQMDVIFLGGEPPPQAQVFQVPIGFLLPVKTRFVQCIVMVVPWTDSPTCGSLWFLQSHQGPPGCISGLSLVGLQFQMMDWKCSGCCWKHARSFSNLNLLHNLLADLPGVFLWFCDAVCSLVVSPQTSEGATEQLYFHWG